MPGATAIAVFALIWLLGCAVVIWLVWRAARGDQRAQRDAERAETPAHPVSRDDEAA
jgi:threonine/homoserine/homoserine lactone efflux protein